MEGMKRNIFPGGNTTEGFFSYYEYILGQKEANRIICLKGGPGVGKSTFMRSIAEHFLEKGESIDFMWCSSDPDSLDGVVLKQRKIAIIDATRPHMVDPVNPGAVDNIVHLGEFWNGEALKNVRVMLWKATGKLRVGFVRHIAIWLRQEIYMIWWNLFMKMRCRMANCIKLRLIL